jgi:hypothetical protein
MTPIKVHRVFAATGTAAQQVVEPLPEPGTRYFDLDRFAFASGVAGHWLRDLSTGMKICEPYTPYVIKMLLREAVDVEEGISCAREEIGRFFPYAPVWKFQLFKKAPPQIGVVAHEILWEEFRSFVDRVKLHRHLGETGRWSQFRRAVLGGRVPNELEFSKLFKLVEREQDRVIYEHEPPTVIGKPEFVAWSVYRTPAEWGKVFDRSWKTVRRQIEKKEFTAEPRNRKSWRFALGDLPSTYEDTR